MSSNPPDPRRIEAAARALARKGIGSDMWDGMNWGQQEEWRSDAELVVTAYFGASVVPDPTPEPARQQCAEWDECREPIELEVNGKPYCLGHNPWHNGGPDDPCVFCRSAPVGAVTTDPETTGER